MAKRRQSPDQTAGDATREELHLLAHKKRERQAALGALKRGASQAKRGELVDGGKFFNALIAKMRDS